MKENRQDSKNLTLDGMTGPHTLSIIFAVVMIVAGIYLTKHYFQAHFPKGLNQGSLCNISGYFNCDVTTFSKLGNVFGIPTSFFGGIVGVFFLFGSLFPSPTIERTNKFVALLNAGLVLILSFYSLVFLKGLCPMCSVYWVSSFIVAFLFYKYGVEGFNPNIKVLVGYLVPVIAGGAILLNMVKAEESEQSKIGKEVVKQYFNLPNVGDPKVAAETFLWRTTPDGNKAPLQISIFSDFQCPACKALSDYVDPIIRKYGSDVNINYYFYPLDDNCNTKMNYPLHPYACQAARLSHCMKGDFLNFHHHLFKNQGNLSTKWLNDLAKEKGMLDCMNSEEVKKVVTSHLQIGDELGVSSTPTFFINGVKIEGVIPLGQLYSIFDAVIEKAKK